jgi:hypothetical protein
MPAEFHASQDFTRDLCDQVASLEPHNPFHTFAYAAAMKDLGTQPWLLYTVEQGRIVSGCLGILKSGRLNRALEIPSVPDLASGDAFWMALERFCHQARIGHLDVESFGSSAAEIPSLRGEIARRARTEYVLNLENPNLLSDVSTNHRRNIQKAQKVGVIIDRSNSPRECELHARLQDASMERRMNRGERVSVDAKIRTSAVLLEHHAGELFRATLEGQVYSSILILRASQGAYYHSAGTSRQGMAIGASHFLISRVAEILRTEGIKRFNLGGADACNPGLERFKTGYGARALHLEAAQFSLGNPLQRGIGAALSFLRRVAHSQVIDDGESPSSVKAKPRRHD